MHFPCQNIGSRLEGLTKVMIHAYVGDGRCKLLTLNAIQEVIYLVPFCDWPFILLKGIEALLELGYVLVKGKLCFILVEARLEMVLGILNPPCLGTAPS